MIAAAGRCEGLPAGLPAFLNATPGGAIRFGRLLERLKSVLAKSGEVDDEVKCVDQAGPDLCL